MNYVDVMGGLGNQLFQYTFHKYCEKMSGRKTLLRTDFFRCVEFMEGATDRKFALDKYKGDYVGITGRITCGQIIKEEELQDINNGMNETFFTGYWQDKRFFTEVKEEILKEICLKDEYLTEDLNDAAAEIEQSNSVALHIRRGDYLNAVNREIFNVLPVEYYKKALEEIICRDGKDIRVFVFTEDTEYASDILGEFGDVWIKIMPVRADYEDLYLMSLAKHHIIANSSFSWWGAALSKRENGEVIAPEKWFLHTPSPDLYLKNWIRI